MSELRAFSSRGCAGVSGRLRRRAIQLSFIDPWEFYIDESYNRHVFCVGGFLAHPEMWKEISDAWQARIECESRRSAIKGFPPISRYHATDCANLKKEFDEKKGWDVPRQIRLTKRLCRIIGNAGPCGIVIGGRIDDMKQYLGAIEGCPRASLYDICFRMSLVTVVSVIRDRFPGMKVKVIYDHTEEFGSVAKNGFEALKDDDGVAYLRDCFTEIVPADSRKCIPLQPTDFLTYEALRRLDGIRKGNEQIRKSLQSLIGTDIPLHIAQFTDENFADMKRMLDNKRSGRQISEGVESALAVAVSSERLLAPLP